jgi:protocatechuate 3,4-dioxygenase beta subunit
MGVYRSFRSFSNGLEDEMERRTMLRRHALRLFAATPALAGCAGPAMSLFDSGPAINPDGGTDAGFDGGADAGICESTHADALGPFWEANAPQRMMIAGLDEPGERLWIEGVVVDARDCARPLANYVLDLWQADTDGNYYAAGTSAYRLRGMFSTSADGRFAFETIIPGSYVTTDGPRPAHLHANIFRPSGGSALLTTQIYFAGDPFLGINDGCQPPTCFSDDLARTLQLEPTTVAGRSGQRAFLRLIVPA